MTMKTKTMKTKTIAILTASGLLASSGTALADNALDRALADGAERLAADEITKRFVGRTGKWVSASGDRIVRIHYGDDATLRAEMVNGDWTGSGRYGVADTDRICISWEGSDPVRLRCLDVVVIDGVVTKFNADGTLNGSYEEFAEGNRL